MSNNKQSSVDLMFNRAISVLPMGAIDARQRLKETYEQAKAMHKDEILNAHTDGFFTPSDYFNPDNYYNVIFNNNE